MVKNIWKSYIWTVDKDANESDPRSNVHYLGSSENKAWKKFRPVRDLNPWPLRYRCSGIAPRYLVFQLSLVSLIEARIEEKKRKKNGGEVSREKK